VDPPAGADTNTRYGSYKVIKVIKSCYSVREYSCVIFSQLKQINLRGLLVFSSIQTSLICPSNIKHWLHQIAPRDKVKSKVDDSYRGFLRQLQNRSTILPLFIGPHAAAIVRRFSMKALARYQVILNRGTLGVNNLPRVVARIMPRPESNPRPVDHESDALPLHYRVTAWKALGL